eukprot:CAMPEP_0184335200 /NCGR_PEP_ID=MMETSP1089-20130417/3812_1 /TAXON_ID=38269 ORGANISM="Gloeochaete wittrockiana, Strain SAG46.84" /NCGR_SAMPLE_ID=MMETSP1089 /ASSEMBLY_ACC=CAM_ASM_000445 /LENGTH=143 /DNA_ID=CAMNT_0026659751 /DNA_START=93 /DNA_END=524 /DNA_ORIENTATION=+
MSAPSKPNKLRVLNPIYCGKTAVSCCFGCVKGCIQDVGDTYVYCVDKICGCPGRTKKKIVSLRDFKPGDVRKYLDEKREGCSEFREECCTIKDRSLICCFMTPCGWIECFAAMGALYLWFAAYWIFLMLIYMSIGSYMYTLST